MQNSFLASLHLACVVVWSYSVPDAGHYYFLYIFFKLRAVAVSPVFQLVPVLLDGSPEYQCTHCFPQLKVFYEIYVDVFCPVAQVICKDI